MEKVCGILVFLAVYQLSGMLHYHDAPIMQPWQMRSACNTASQAIGFGNLC